jgi:hypothetical protein
MKQIKIYSLAALNRFSPCTLPVAASFLEEKPLSFTSASTFYQTEAQAQAAVNACYL